MSKHRILKRAAAGLIASALAFGGLSAGAGGFLSGIAALKASAAESAVGKPSSVWGGELEFNESETEVSHVSVDGGASVKIGNTAKCCVTVDGSLNVGSYGACELVVCDGSYLVVTEDLRLGAGATVRCEGDAKIILYSTENEVPLSVSSSAVFDIADFAGTNLTNLMYFPDYIPSKDYFESNGDYYTFDGVLFTKIKEDLRTRSLEEICTEQLSRDVWISPAASGVLMLASSNGTLTKGLRGYTFDGETVDEMYIPAKQYSQQFLMPPATLFMMDFMAHPLYGAGYIITEDEVPSVVTQPRFSKTRIMVSMDLTMYFEFDNISEDTLDDFSVVVTGPCAETGQHQKIRKIVYSDAFVCYGVSATIPVNYMSEIVTAQLYYKGEKVDKPFATTMEKYLQVLSGSTQTKEISDSIICYGKTAANYFNQKRNDVSTEIADYVEKYGLDPDHIDTTFEGKAPTFPADEGKTSLVLDTQIVLRCYWFLFDLAGYSEGDVVGGYTVHEDSYGKYFEVNGVEPWKMLEINANLKATPPNGVTTVYNFNYCTWIYRVLTDPELSGSAMYDLAVGIYAYARTSYDLVASLSQS